MHDLWSVALMLSGSFTLRLQHKECFGRGCQVTLAAIAYMYMYIYMYSYKHLLIDAYFFILYVCMYVCMELFFCNG